MLKQRCPDCGESYTIKKLKKGNLECTYCRYSGPSKEFKDKEKIIKLYKFRSLENFEFTADILLNNRLYASDFRNLNDPMEGIFMSNPKKKKKHNLIDKIISKKEKLKICSLSKWMTNPILWAHYADGFRGICIEIEADRSKLDIEKIDYQAFVPDIDYTSYKGMDTENFSSNDWAKIILIRKFGEWKYEEEYRIFSKKPFITNDFKITAVYLGMRISDVNKRILEKIVPDDVDVVSTSLYSFNVVLPSNFSGSMEEYGLPK